MIRQIAHICLGATDLTVTERFYCEGLGLEKRFLFRKGGEVIGFYLHAGNNTFIEVFRRGAVEVTGKASIQHLCLETDEIDGLLARLTAQGIAVGEKKLGKDGSWQFWIKDPDGTPIEFHQYTDASSQRTGADCIVNG